MPAISVAPTRRTPLAVDEVSATPRGVLLAGDNDVAALRSQNSFVAYRKTTKGQD